MCRPYFRTAELETRAIEGDLSRHLNSGERGMHAMISSRETDDRMRSSSGKDNSNSWSLLQLGIVQLMVVVGKCWLRVNGKVPQ